MLYFIHIGVDILENGNIRLVSYIFVATSVSYFEVFVKIAEIYNVQTFLNVDNLLVL